MYTLTLKNKFSGKTWEEETDSIFCIFYQKSFFVKNYTKNFWKKTKIKSSCHNWIDWALKVFIQLTEAIVLINLNFYLLLWRIDFIIHLDFFMIHHFILWCEFYSWFSLVLIIRRLNLIFFWISLLSLRFRFNFTHKWEDTIKMLLWNCQQVHRNFSVLFMFAFFNLLLMYIFVIIEK